MTPARKRTPVRRTSQVDQALADLVPDEISEDGTITIGTDPTYAPNEFLDTDGSTVIGFDVDLFNAVAAKLGLDTEWVASDFSDIIPGVGSAKYEIGVSSFTINAERLETVDMVSYFSAGTQWAVKSGNPSGVDPDAACGKKVAVQTGTVQETDDLPVRNQTCTGAGQPEITIEPYQARTRPPRPSSRARTMQCWPTPSHGVRGTADQRSARAARRDLRRGAIRLRDRKGSGRLRAGHRRRVGSPHRGRHLRRDP